MGDFPVTFSFSVFLKYKNVPATQIQLKALNGMSVGFFSMEGGCSDLGSDSSEWSGSALSLARLIPCN